MSDELTPPFPTDQDDSTATADHVTTATQGVVEAPEAEAESSEQEGPLSAETIEASSPYVGQWNELVSTTNWDKGRVIAEWRAALEEEGAPIAERSDEAWAQLVGFVTSQHVGRLRRVYQRFGETRDQYAGLFWSHFQAALDWDDAEMWLEGAIGNRWSVAKMKTARWEAHGSPEESTPEQEQAYEGAIDGEAYDAADTDSIRPETDAVETPFGDPGDSDSADRSERDDSDEGQLSPAMDYDPAEEPGPPVEAAPRIRPFENLAELPDDVAEAFEQFKLVILSHKLTGWEQISRTDLVATLESLKELALAPSEEEQPA